MESIFLSVKDSFAFVVSFCKTSTISSLLSSDNAWYLSIDFAKPMIKKKIMETVK